MSSIRSIFCCCHRQQSELDQHLNPDQKTDGESDYYPPTASSTPPPGSPASSVTPDSAYQNKITRNLSEEKASPLRTPYVGKSDQLAEAPGVIDYI